MAKNNKGDGNKLGLDVPISHWKWQQVLQSSNSPSARHLHSLVRYNNYLYLFGGCSDGGKYLDDFWRYSLSENSWKKITSKTHPTPRHSHQAVVFKNKMILFGGISDGKTMDDLWSFDFTSESWTQERTLHRAWGHSMAVVADKIIIFGGADDTKVNDNLIALNAHTLDSITLSIDTVPPARQYASMIAHNDTIYLFGGLNNNNKSLNDFYKLSINNNNNNSNHITTETLVVSSIVPCLSGASLSVLSHHSELVLFGGQTNNKLNSIAFAFDIRSSKWSACTSIGPSPRYHHQICTVNGALYMFGGLDRSSKHNKAMNLNDMWMFSGATQQTRQEIVNVDYASMPVEIWSMILSYIDSPEVVAAASVVSKQFYNILITSERAKQQLQKHVSSVRECRPPIANNTIKLVLGGFAGSGKTASVNQFAYSYFVEEYDPTIEGSWQKLLTIDNQNYVVFVLDSAGALDDFMPTIEALMEVWYRTSHGIYMVYSITSRQSFNELDDCIKLAKRAKRNQTFPLIIVGNKSDLESERQVSEDEGKEYAKKHDAMWIETSAKTGHNINEAFTMLAEAAIAADNARTRKPESKSKKDRCALM